MKYNVLVQHFGDKQYFAGQEREVKNDSDAKELLRMGLIIDPKAAAAEKKKAAAEPKAAAEKAEKEAADKAQADKEAAEAKADAEQAKKEAGEAEKAAPETKNKMAKEPANKSE